jgi:ribonuclease HI
VSEAAERAVYVAYADGASRGNPGPSAVGVVMFDADGREVHRLSLRLAHGTNNEAEYRAAIAALEAALGLGASHVEVRMDSELVVRQLTGRYRVRNPRLIPLYKRLLDLRGRFQSIAFHNIPRTENRLADALANQALDHSP